LSISKFFIIFLIPLVILGLGIWMVESTHIDRGSVRVAGAVVGPPNVDVTIKNCYMLEEQGFRKLAVELEAKNSGSTKTDIYPFLFRAVISVKDRPYDPAAPQSSYSPIYYQSICEDAPRSSTSLPPGAMRSLTLHFYANTMPRGDEWEDQYLHLEYYDEDTLLLLSKPLNPEGK